MSPSTDLAAQDIEFAITEIALGMKRLGATRLKRDTIVALIHDRSGVSKRTINLVLNNLEQLEALWLKPKTPPQKTPTK